MAVDGVKFEDAWDRRVESTIDGVRAPFISKDDLRQRQGGLKT
jgi:hypothetical protein